IDRQTSCRQARFHGVGTLDVLAHTTAERVGLMRVARRAAMTQKPLATMNVAVHPKYVARYATATADVAPPRLPIVFMTPETEPLQLSPMSMQMAHDTATVSSRPASAITSHIIAV